MKPFLRFILIGITLLFTKSLMAGCEWTLVKYASNVDSGTEYLTFDRSQNECNATNTTTWAIGYEDEFRYVSSQIAAGKIVLKIFSSGALTKVGKEVEQGLKAILVRPKAPTDVESLREQARFMALASKGLADYQSKVVASIEKKEANAAKISVQVELQVQEWDSAVEDSRSRAMSALLNGEVAKGDIQDAIDIMTASYPVGKDAVDLDQQIYDELKKGMLTENDIDGIKIRLEADLKNFPKTKSLETLNGLTAIASREKNELRRRQYLNILSEFVDENGIVKAWLLSADNPKLKTNGSSPNGIQVRQDINDAAGLKYYGNNVLQVDTAVYALEVAVEADGYLSDADDAFSQQKGKRLADRSRVLIDYQTSSSRLAAYAGVQTSDAASSAFGVTANGSTYEGFQIATIANKLSGLPEVLNSPELYFYATSSLKMANQYSTAPGEGIRFHYAIDSAYAVYDFVKGFAKGIYQFIPNTYDGIKQVVSHPIDTVQGLYTALCNAKQTNEAIFKAIDKFVEEFPNYTAEQYGELSGRITAEIGTAIIAAGLVKKTGDLVKFNAAIAKISEESRIVLRLPETSKFEGTIFRGVPEKFKSTMWEVTDYDGLPNHRYSGPGVKGIYGSLDEMTLMTELESYGLGPGDRFVGSIGAKLNVLDLTNPANLKRFGVDIGRLTEKGNYLTTHIIGEYASKAGFDGLIYQSATSEGKHIVLFKSVVGAP